MRIDKAAMAAQSDALKNRYFGYAGRRWTGPPPPKRNNPGRDTGVVVGILKLSESTSDTAGRSAQRAIQAAERRAAEWDRLADELRAIGHWFPADRLSKQAAGLRASVLG